MSSAVDKSTFDQNTCQQLIVLRDHAHQWSVCEVCKISCRSDKTRNELDFLAVSRVVCPFTPQSVCQTHTTHTCMSTKNNNCPRQLPTQ